MLAYYYRSPQNETIERVAKLKQQGKTIVIASGVFDLLHVAHIEYLRQAKKQGDYLVVLVESDVRTRQLKGEGRPLWNQEKRRDELLKLGFVDEVLILPPDFNTPVKFEEVITLLRPDVYAVSSHSDHLAAKRKLMRQHGGKVVIVLKKIPGISTTEIVRTK